MIEYVDILIGNELIQRITSDYLNANYNLDIPYGKNNGYLQNIGYTDDLLIPNTNLPSKILYIMLPWFFNKPGNNLPMISLINTSVFVNVKFKKLDDLLIVDRSNYKISIIDSNGKQNDRISFGPGIKIMSIEEAKKKRPHLYKD